MSNLPLLGTPGHERTGPVTGRTSGVLAYHYGFTDINELAQEIPPNAEVADVGAGFSTLGHDISARRPDIHWVNIDVCYLDAEFDSYMGDTLHDLVTYAPNNLQYMGASILEPPADLKRRRFTHIFSYYMLPHVIGNGRDYGLVAVRNMLNMGIVDGTLRVGPHSNLLGGSHDLTIPSSSEDTDRLAQETVDSWHNNR